MSPSSRDLTHLGANRPAIIERSAVAAMLSLLPVPILDEILAGAVRSELLRRIAASRNVDADEAAIGRVSEVAARAALVGAGVRGSSRLLGGRRLRRMAAVVRTAGSVDDLALNFAVATLFDHYCARHHVGAGLDAEGGRRLAAAIEGAILDARGAVLARGARRLLRGLRLLLTAAPRRLLRGIPGLPRLAERGVAEGELVPDGRPPPPPRAGGYVRRGLRGVADAATASAVGWIEELLRAFDARWATGTPAGSTP